MDYNERITDVVGGDYDIRYLQSRNLGPLKFEILDGLESILSSRYERKEKKDN